MNSSRWRSHSAALGSSLGSHFISCTITALNKYSVPCSLTFINLALLSFLKDALSPQASSFFFFFFLMGVREEYLLCADIVLGIVHILISSLILVATWHNRQMRKLSLNNCLRVYIAFLAPSRCLSLSCPSVKFFRICCFSRICLLNESLLYF